MLPRTLLLTAVLTGLTAAADKDQPPAKADYSQLAGLIHAAIVPKLPKEIDDRTHWGSTIPDPGNLKLPQLARTRVKVGDREELAHGQWVRTRLWIDDPDKDVQIEVRDLRKIDAKTVQLQVAATVHGHGERERRQYEKGLLLFGLPVQADAVVVLVLDFDVGLTLSTAKFPPEVIVEPKVTKTQLELKEFDLRKVGKLMIGEKGRELGHELKGVLQEQLKKLEPALKEKANEAIARGLKEGKGTLSAEMLLKAEPMKKE